MGILLLKNAISFKTPSTADLVYRKSGSLMSKYVMETGESWRKFHNYIFLKVDMVHPLDASMCHIPSCICRRIRRFPSYCRIYDNTHYLTPPHLRKPAPCTYLGWRTPRGTLAHSFKYIKMVCKQSINPTQDTGQANHGLTNIRITVVASIIPSTTSAFFLRPLGTRS